MNIAPHNNHNYDNQLVREADNYHIGGSGDVTTTTNTFKKSIKNNHHNNSSVSLRFSTSKKIRHCSIEAEEAEKTKTIFFSNNNNIDVSPPPLIKSSVRIRAYSHLHSCENGANPDTKGPIIMSLDACVQHRCFHDLMGGILEHRRLLLYIQSGWIPTSVYFLHEENKKANLCYPLTCLFSKKAVLIDDIYVENNLPEKANKIDCEATYRALHANFFASGWRLRSEVLLERDTPAISTESFELYIFLRDLLLNLGITSNLRYFSRETSQRSLFAQKS